MDLHISYGYIASLHDPVSGFVHSSDTVVVVSVLIVGVDGAARVRTPAEAGLAGRRRSVAWVRPPAEAGVRSGAPWAGVGRLGGT